MQLWEFICTCVPACSCSGKEYCLYVDNGKIHDPIHRRYRQHVFTPLDRAAMRCRRASQPLPLFHSANHEERQLSCIAEYDQAPCSRCTFRVLPVGQVGHI